MRKCLSVVAVASAAFGLAACSSPAQHRESAGAVRPLSAPASPGAQALVRAGAGHVAPVVVAPAVPAASGAVVQGQGQAQAQKPQSGDAAQHAAAAVGAPVLAPSGTSDGPAQPARSRAAAPVRSAAGAPALAPASPRPAPPPPPAQDANTGYDPNASATAQIFDAVAAARTDGKEVLLDFGANWCTACRALDSAMHSPRAAAILARSYHVVHIDLGNGDPQHMQVATMYDPLGSFGMPLLVVLNPDGTVRADSARSGEPKYTEADVAAWLNQWVAR